MRVVCAIPAYNEELTIASIVLLAKQYVDEVIVIDDGSKDRTVELAKKAGAIVYKHKKNKGYGAAIKSCIEKAKQRNADILVILDADGQHDPRDIPKLVEPIKDGEADLVIGSRFITRQKMPKYRKFGIKIINLFAKKFLTKKKISDTQSGFRAYSRKVLEALDLSDESMGVSLEILNEVVKKGFRIKEVPIKCRYDIEGSTLNPLRHGMQLIGTIIKIVERERPLFFFGVSGICMLMLAMLLGVWVIHRYETVGQLAVGTSLLVVLLTMLGILTLYSGIILHAIKVMSEK